MDREQAQFVLQSFRPDGADASDADFAEALQLAAQDRVLGEWLADERAADAAFAAALGEVEIPEALRQQILAVIRGEEGAKPEPDEAMDSVLMDAVGELQPPRGLREQILAAMHVQQGQTGEAAQDVSDHAAQTGNVMVGWFNGWSRVAAVAAAVVIGAFVAFQVTTNHPEVTTSHAADGLVESYQVQHHAGNIIDASFRSDVEGVDAEGVSNWMVSRNLTTPSSIPQRLRAIDGLGCKEIRLPGGQRAAIICFHEKGRSPLYLVIVNNDYVRDRALPAMTEVTTKDCYHCPETKWNVARWRDASNTYILLAKKAAAHKDKLLEYF